MKALFYRSSYDGFFAGLKLLSSLDKALQDSLRGPFQGVWLRVQGFGAVMFGFTA